MHRSVQRPAPPILLQGTNLHSHSVEDLRCIEDRLKKVLGWKTPFEVFTAAMAPWSGHGSDDHSTSPSPDLWNNSGHGGRFTRMARGNASEEGGVAGR